VDTKEALKQTINRMVKDLFPIITNMEAGNPKAFDFNNPIDLQTRDIMLITLISEAFNDALIKYQDILVEKEKAAQQPVILMQ
jgi:hypothetical protein